MKLTFVEVSGFRSFKNKTRFEFPNGFAVLTGRNGAGKSSVLDAIDYALTGSINKYSVTDAKGGGLEKHIWWVGAEEPDKHYVSVGFIEDSGESFVINRTRERGIDIQVSELGHRFCVGQLLAADWPQTLMQTTLIRDETIASLSLDLPEQARFAAVKVALEGLAGVNHSTRTNVLVQAAMQAKTAQEAQVSKVEGELSRTLGALTEARSLADKQTDVGEAEKIISSLVPELIAVTSDRRELIRKRVADRRQSIPALTEAVGFAERAQSEEKYFRSEVGIADVAAARSTRDAALASREHAKEKLVDAQRLAAVETQNNQFASQLVAVLQHGEAIGLQGGHCPLCNAERTNEEFASAIAAARAKLIDIGRRSDELAATIRAAESALAEAEKTINDAEQRLVSLETRQLNLKRDLETVSNTFKKWGFAASESLPDVARLLLLKRQEETANLEHALLILEASSVHDRVTALEGRVIQLRSLLEEETAKLTAGERALEGARQIDKAAKGVANQILTEQFDTVMPLLKELYQRLRPHTDWREIEIDFGGSVRASLNFTVGDGRNPQFLFSSGQRRAAGIAFLLAMHLSRPWCRLRSLLLDDPVQHIDDYRALNLVEVLSAVRQAGRQVIVTIEDPALADVLCRRLRSTISEPGRRFELGTSKDGSSKIEEQLEIYPLPNDVFQTHVA